MAIASAREQVGHSGAGVGSSMTASTPPSGWIMPGHKTAALTRVNVWGVLTLRHLWAPHLSDHWPLSVRGDLVTGREVEERSVSAPSTGAASE